MQRIKLSLLLLIVVLLDSACLQFNCCAPLPAGTPNPYAGCPDICDPTNLIYEISSDPKTFDPHRSNDPVGLGILQNIYEGLITYDRVKPNKFVPVLARSIPKPANNADGSVTYTWSITDGVKFHNGDDLTAEDVAYSFWRSLLLSGPESRSYFLLNAFFNIDDPTQLVDPKGNLVGKPDALKKAGAQKLNVVCHRVEDAIAFDNLSHTVTMRLIRPRPSFMPSLVGGQAAIVDKQWQIAQGDWDGDCKIWQNFYNRSLESSPVYSVANGTGPYQLDHWIPKEEVVLLSNETYQKGKPFLTRVVIKQVDEFSTRFAAFQAGDADAIEWSSQAEANQLDTLTLDECDIHTGKCQPYQPLNPSGILRLYRDVPTTDRTDAFFNFKITKDSKFIGSGQLDGEGIPPDFFNDVHIRHAFNYCFDWDAYVKQAMSGEGIQSIALTLPDESGYAGSPAYSFDLAKCAKEFKASTLKAKDKKSVWEAGFYLQIPYTPDDLYAPIAVQILSANLAKVSEKFLVVPVAVPESIYRQSLKDGQAPLFFSTWQEAMHDPDQWYHTYFLNQIAASQNLPLDLRKKYQPLIDQGTAELDPVKRADIYQQLNALIYDDAPLMILANAFTRHYEPLYMKDWFGSLNQNPMIPPFYYYQLSKN